MYAEYDEEQVLECDPIELVRLLYGKALEKLGLARTLTAADQVRERNTAIARASEILIELQGSLDAEAGGEIAADLERLYEYIQQLLAQGLASRADEPLAEASTLLETLAEGWREAADSLKPAPSDDDAPEPVLEEAAAGRAWTV